MKDWLTVIIVLVIIGIVLDGIRRMRLAKRESISLSKNAKKADKASELQVSSNEFPSGGARVVTVRDDKDAENFNDNVRKSFGSKRVTVGAARRIPEQVSLNLDESVPMLMDSVDEVEELEGDEDFSDTREPAIGNFEDLQDADNEQGSPTISAEEFDSIDTPLDPVPEPEPEPKRQERQESQSKDEDLVVEEYVEPDEVLIMNVMAKPGQRIPGGDLLAALMEEGLKFGDMDIFHRHKDNDGDGPILYSIANMVVPGTFNLAAMAEFETPGISIFLGLPVAEESLAVYDDMARTAKNLAANLTGDLKDENRSVMTSQTIEHGRQRVIEYERKRKLARA